MRAVIQRTTQSQVTVDGELVGKAGAGLTVLLGVGAEDTAEDARYLADKIVNLRIFEDADGKMNRSLLDIGGEILAISFIRRRTQRPASEFYRRRSAKSRRAAL